MAAIEQKNLLVAVKAFARANALPLDQTEVYGSLAEAQAYAKQANAYAGQTVKALVNGEYKSYVLNPSESGYVLKEVGAEVTVPTYVQMPSELPETGEQGVLYIVGTTGSIWTGSVYKTVFEKVDISPLETRVEALETAKGNLEAADTALGDRVKALEDKDIAGDIAKAKTEAITAAGTAADEKDTALHTTITGEIATAKTAAVDDAKAYADGLVANITNCTPGVVTVENGIPADAKPGQTWRVAEAGTYADNKCEVGDLIICIAKGEYMVVQANIDGAVTSTANSAIVGNIVVFDSVTGKVVKDSGFAIDSLTALVTKVDGLDTKVSGIDTRVKALEDKDIDGDIATAKEAAITAAKEYADGKDTALHTTITGEIDTAKTAAVTEAKKYADDQDEALHTTITSEISTAKDEAVEAAKTAANTYTDEKKAAVDAEITTIKKNLDAKISTEDAEAKIATAKTEAVEAADAAFKKKLGEDFPADDTIKQYVDRTAQAGGADVSAAIATAKAEAIAASKEYADGLLAVVEI